MMKTLKPAALEWRYSEEWGTLELHFQGGVLWIAARPAYCDRGHWQLNCDASALYLDASDRFPRYYMNLAHAVEEAESFLLWRVGHVPHPSCAGGREMNLRTFHARQTGIVIPTGDSHAT